MNEEAKNRTEYYMEESRTWRSGESGMEIEVEMVG